MKNNKIKVVCMTCICADVYYGTDFVEAGGEALNSASALSSFPNIDCYIIGCVGSDDYGKIIMEVINNLKVNKSNIRVQNGVTANNITYLTDKGDRYYKDDSWTGGVHDEFVLSHLDKQLLSECQIVHTSVYCPVLNDILDLKDKYSFKLSVDFNNRRDFENYEYLLEKSDVFFVSGNEDVANILLEKSKKYNGVYIATFAENGSASYKNGIEYRVLAEIVPENEVVDSTGCGDNYQAGFIAEYMQSGDIIKAMKVGSHLGAEIIKQRGGVKLSVRK